MHRQTSGPNMQTTFFKRETALIGFMLPAIPMLGFALLAVLSLTASPIAPAIAADKLTILLVILSPAVYLVGAALSVWALCKTPMKITAAAGAVLNIGMMIFLALTARSFLVDFQLAG